MNIDWKQPYISGNPYFMQMMWGMAIATTLVEAHYARFGIRLSN
jgi:hypothetical protein